jgi:hypothetical protein
MTRFLSMLGLMAAIASTALGDELRYTPAYQSDIPQFSLSWTPLPLLPRRFQNHCGYFDGHYVCANHCGPNYQIYYCSDWSFGCCHIGHGYCNAGGVLRCAPHYFPFN